MFSHPLPLTYMRAWTPAAAAPFPPTTSTVRVDTRNSDGTIRTSQQTHASTKNIVGTSPYIAPEVSTYLLTYLGVGSWLTHGIWNIARYSYRIPEYSE